MKRLLILFLLISGSSIFSRHVPIDHIDYATHIINTHNAGDRRNNDIDVPLFVPDQNVKDALRGLIQATKKSIYVAAFTLTDKDIAFDLIAAFKRGVTIRVIVDKSAFESNFEKVSSLIEAGIPVKVFEGKSSNIMHYKLIIFEGTIDKKDLVWNGSANFSKAGLTTNQEYVNIRSNRTIFDRFTRQFCKLWNLPIMRLCFKKQNPRVLIRLIGLFRRIR